MNFPLYSQRDPRWKDLHINNTASTMEFYGCAITSLSMLYSGFGHHYDPGQMEALLQSTGAFVSDLILWIKVPYFQHRFYCEDKIAPVADIKAQLAAGKPVLLGVHIGSANPYKTNHWVLAVDEHFTIYDPWYGDIQPLTHRYGANPEKAILGGAYFDVPQLIPVIHEYPKHVTVSSQGGVWVRPTPGTEHTSVASYLQGHVFEAQNLVDGQSVNGNSKWYQETDARFIWSGACR